MIPNRDDKLTPDYTDPRITDDQHTTIAPRFNVCPFAAASIIIPVITTAYMRSDNYLKFSYLDNELGLGHAGMFRVKLSLMAIPFLIAIPAAFWSLLRKPKLPLLHRRPLALFALLLNLIFFLYCARIIYHLYHGYL
jgi:hypothetical protein